MEPEASQPGAGHGPPQDVAVSVPINWDSDYRNPRNWSLWRKTAVTAIVSIIGFVCTMAASIYTPGADQVASEMHVSTAVSLLPLSFYNLGMAFGPIISSPLSETFGRKAVYLTTLPPFALFTLGAGFSQDISSLIVCRFFAGTFGAPGVSIASATIADICAPVNRAIPLSFYYAVPFVGSLSGVLIGGYVVESKGWRWTQWTVLFFTVVTLSSIIFVRESYKKIIYQRLEGVPVGDRAAAKSDFLKEFQYFLTKTIIRPIHMLFTEPIVGFVCLYASFQFALLYTFVVASPHIFQTTYGFSLGTQGLTFLGFIVGVSLSTIPIIVFDRLLYQRKFAQFTHTHALTPSAPSSPSSPSLGTTNPTDPTTTEFPPEHRLYSPMLGSLLLPLGLFLFAWTTHPSIPALIPILFQGLTIFGSLLVYAGANMYMMDTYGPLYGASATGASSLSRYTLSAAFPLFALPMYEALGTGWATSVLAFGTVAMAPIPWVFWWWGPGLRARSGYERSV
ncbi:MFS general substrate transporter [Viridothelium virens]|uniref:MFS general substrate transporter n=1 Tax=Viridothelium virens TaxID=1048519 RepID=A0A6A6H5M0_VIRVR|nr:MFS general substrate transporter [Viridothelium virens]